jgi:hypothetical protein
MATATAVGGLNQPINLQESQTTDLSQAYGIYDQSQGSKLGSSVTLAGSAGNTISVVDPGAIVAGQNVAIAGLNANMLGLNRITDSAQLAVTRALQLAGEIQGGEAGKIVELLKYLAIGGGLLFVASKFFGGKKAANAS